MSAILEFSKTTIQHLIQKGYCPTCHQTELSLTDQALTCESCNTSYPLVYGSIPLLMREPRKHVLQVYLQYRQYIQEQHQVLQSIERALAQKPSEKLRRLQQGVRQNLSLIEQFQQGLLPALPSMANTIDLIYTPGLEAHSYVTNFDYLRTDWSGLEESEEEITQIADHFKQLLPTDDQTELLVLGAGAGRVAWQLADDFASVIAMDNSPSMVGFFYTALQQAIPFYELNTTNCFDTAEFLRPLQAKVPTPKTDKFRMFLGDALHLPYPDQSVDAVASIFFTDMVPFAGLLEELKRVLKPGGTFIHYGPLQYHFSDLSQRLSGAEIKAELEANGFSIRTEAFWQSGHCTSAWAHLKKTYTIWGMKAEKLPAPPPVILQNDAILAIVDQLTVQRQYLLSNSPEEQLNSTELWTSDKKYEGAETIVDILSLIDGQKTIGTLFQELAGVYPDLDEAAIGQVKQILTGFVQTGVLELKTGA